MLRNPDDPKANSYSILGKLNDTNRGLDNKFHFKILWPARTGHNYNVWKHASNPLSNITSGVQGYEAEDVNFVFGNWGGLEINTNPNSLLDGSIGVDHWFYAIGMTNHTPFFGGIPGAENPEEIVELYVRKAGICDVTVAGPVPTYNPTLFPTPSPPSFVPSGAPSLTPTPSTCNDGVQNGKETDVDCGGYECHSCSAQKNCTQNFDCVSKSCITAGGDRCTRDAVNCFCSIVSPSAIPTSIPTVIPTAVPSASPTISQ
jgi:hypothetical protein